MSFGEKIHFGVKSYDVEVDDSMRNQALTFAKEIILSNNQYSRLLPENIKESGDISLQIKIEIQRTYMGKLGELAFQKFLVSKGKEVSAEGMLEIYEGQDNVDTFDFKTINGKTVDVKTGFRNIHKRLLVNLEQFNRIPKDYYVAVKLNADDYDSSNKLVDLSSVDKAIIIGYAEHSYMENSANIYNFGEGPAKYLEYNELKQIDNLLDKF